jgi:hypothetical protein
LCHAPSGSRTQNHRTTTHDAGLDEIARHSLAKDRLDAVLNDVEPRHAEHRVRRIGLIRAIEALLVATMTLVRELDAARLERAQHRATEHSIGLDRI